MDLENNEQFDEEAYLKSLDDELNKTKNLAEELQKLSLEIKEANKIAESYVTDEMRKAYNASLEIEKEKHEETKFFNSLTDEEKIEYLKKCKKEVSDYYHENNIATVGENMTDEDFE